MEKLCGHVFCPGIITVACVCVRRHTLHGISMPSRDLNESTPPLAVEYSLRLTEAPPVFSAEYSPGIYSGFVGRHSMLPPLPATLLGALPAYPVNTSVDDAGHDVRPQRTNVLPWIGRLFYI